MRFLYLFGTSTGSGMNKFFVPRFLLLLRTGNVFRGKKNSTASSTTFHLVTNSLTDVQMKQQPHVNSVRWLPDSTFSHLANWCTMYVLGHDSIIEITKQRDRREAVLGNRALCDRWVSVSRSKTRVLKPSRQVYRSCDPSIPLTRHRATDNSFMPLPRLNRRPAVIEATSRVGRLRAITFVCSDQRRELILPSCGPANPPAPLRFLGTRFDLSSGYGYNHRPSSTSDAVFSPRPPFSPLVWLVILSARRVNRSRF